MGGALDETGRILPWKGLGCQRPALLLFVLRATWEASQSDAHDQAMQQAGKRFAGLTIRGIRPR